MRYAELFRRAGRSARVAVDAADGSRASPEFVLFAARDVALGVPAMRVDVECIWPAG